MARFVAYLHKVPSIALALFVDANVQIHHIEIMMNTGMIEIMVIFCLHHKVIASISARKPYKKIGVLT